MHTFIKGEGHKERIKYLKNKFSICSSLFCGDTEVQFYLLIKSLTAVSAHGKDVI